MDEKILALIRERDEYISGEEISKKLNVSRAGIWKHIEKLREEGYNIVATPHLGYRFISPPDRLIHTEVSWGLNTKVFGKKIYAFKKTDSTNTVAYKLAEDGEQEGTVVFAEEQGKGKGRFRRTWSSPVGGIYMSLILRPEFEPLNTARVTLGAAVAVAEAVREVTNLSARIKWPNDVLVEKQKVAGILTEMKAQQDALDFVILGIGVNVNIPKNALPKGATSLKEELNGLDVSKVELAKRILELLEGYYARMRDRFDEIINDWRKLSDTLGSRIKVHSHGQVLDGQALDVDENGGLILRLDSGFNKHIFSGDVETIRS
jgi:BirA family transcriptional regulator, biotin operon repressor / biotin---[acetyl-CoA-carboxylase] ligase